MAAYTRSSRRPTVPAWEPPKELIAEMVAAGATKEEIEGEDLRVVRIDGVHSAAWKVYEDGACSLGEVDPVVTAALDPPLEIEDSCLCPVDGCGIEREARSIINHLAPLLIADFPANSVPVLPGPLRRPQRLTNIHHAKVAVTALLQAISNPGANYPVIDGLRTGHYICDVDYTWRGAVITVPIFRKILETPAVLGSAFP